jgi:protein-tyrosine-phosphatase
VSESTAEPQLRGRHSSLNIVTLCTGNVARSVMLGYMLIALSEGTNEQWTVRTAGTFVTEGSAMSSRTKSALLVIPELGERQYGAHRSHQIDEDDVEWADLILASEAGHVRYARTKFTGAHTKTVQLSQFVRRAPIEVPFADQLAAVSALTPSSLFDVPDPAGGDQSVYDACALQLWELAKAFALLVGEDPRT